MAFQVMTEAVERNIHVGRVRIDFHASNLLKGAATTNMQTETGTRFTGNWSWAPYLITTVVLGGFATLAIFAINKDAKRD